MLSPCRRLLGLVCAEGQRTHRLAQEREDLILAKKLQRREVMMPSGKKRKVAQMKEKCMFLSHCENLNRPSKPCTLRLTVPLALPYASNEPFECKTHVTCFSVLRVQLLHLPVRPSKRATVCTSSRRKSYRIWPWWTGLATLRSGADGFIDTPSCLLMCENV